MSDHATAVTVVVGNPRPRSRTAAAATAVGERIAQQLGWPDGVRVVDLAEHAGRMFDAADEVLTSLTDTVAASAVCVVASPTYKATYTGLLKAFFDRFGTDGLAGVVAVPMMVGGTPLHALAPEVHLRPVLVELGAIIPTRALYLLDSELEDLEPALGRWEAAAMRAIGALTGADTAHREAR